MENICTSTIHIISEREDDKCISHFPEERKRTSHFLYKQLIKTLQQYQQQEESVSSQTHFFCTVSPEDLYRLSLHRKLKENSDVFY